jgi:hypothetical protein
VKLWGDDELDVAESALHAANLFAEMFERGVRVARDRRRLEAGD